MSQFRDVLERTAGQGLAVSPNYAELCRVLVGYAGYELEMPAGSRPEPFDDPYVAAALLIDGRRVVGLHRKAAQHERHAEVLAILQALRAVGTPEAEETVAAIDRGLEQKVWLLSAGARRGFVENFKWAGDLLRKHHKGRTLEFVSTLEPCRDFETQPGCAHLLAALSPSVVAYAADDTNTKGQGRSVLVDAGVSVLPNLAVQDNLRINRLFYATMHYLPRVIDAADLRVGSSRVDLQACKLEYSIVSPK